MELSVGHPKSLDERSFKNKKNRQKFVKKKITFCLVINHFNFTRNIVSNFSRKKIMKTQQFHIFWLSTNSFSREKSRSSFLKKSWKSKCWQLWFDEKKCEKMSMYGMYSPFAFTRLLGFYSTPTHQMKQFAPLFKFSACWHRWLLEMLPHPQKIRIFSYHPENSCNLGEVALYTFPTDL